MWRMPRGVSGHDLISKNYTGESQTKMSPMKFEASRGVLKISCGRERRNGRCAGCEQDTSTLGGAPMSSRLVVSLALPSALFPAAPTAAERPVVVELFTSQGCSSCPPANAYLNEMARERQDVLPLAFHVTYWDRLGWKDPFSLEAATERQDRYGHRFGDGSYTPEIVVDGASSHVGSQREDIRLRDRTGQTREPDRRRRQRHQGRRRPARHRNRQRHRSEPRCC